MTSGGVLLASAVVSFSWMPVHFWTSYLTLMPFADSNSLFKASVRVGAAEPSMSHTVISLVSVVLPLFVLVPQPDTATASAAAPAASPLQPFTIRALSPSPAHRPERPSGVDQCGTACAASPRLSSALPRRCEVIGRISERMSGVRTHESTRTRHPCDA